MADLATLSLSIDSRPAAEASVSLDRLAGSAGRAETAADTLTAAFGRSTKAANENAAAEARASGAVNALRAAIDPLAASQQRLNKLTAEATTLLKAGSISQAEHTRLIGMATKAHTDLETRVGKSTAAVGLNGHEWRNLGFQVNDAVTMLLSGSSAFQVVATQGGQVAQVLGGAQGGVGAALASIVSAVPLAMGVFGGLASGAGAAALAYNSFDKSQKAVASGLTGIGRQSGVLPGDIMDIGRKSPLGISKGEDLATALASTGYANVSNITAASSQAKNLQATLGIDFETTKKTYADLFNAPSESLAKLDDRLRFASAGLRGYVADLQSQGKNGEAARAVIDAMNGSLGKYSDLTSQAAQFTDFYSEKFTDFTKNFERSAAYVFGDKRVDSMGSLQKEAAMYSQQAANLQKQLTATEETRKRLLGAGLGSDEIDRLYPIGEIRSRLNQVAQAQEEVSARTIRAQEATTLAIRNAAAEQARFQSERVNTVVSTLQRRNSDARLNPVEQATVQAQREAGVYEENDLATRLQKLAQNYKPLRDAEQMRGSSLVDQSYITPKYEPIGRHASPGMFDQIEKDQADFRKSQIATQVEEGNRINQTKMLTEVQRQSTTALEAEGRALGKNVGQSEAARQAAALRSAVGAQGVKVDADVERQIEAQSAALGRLVQANAEARLSSELRFQREQTNRTPSEAAIAAQLRPTYGDDLSSKGAQTAAEYMRATNAIQDTQRAMSSLGQMGSSLIDPLLDSTRSWSGAFSDLSKQIARAALQSALFGQGPFAAAFGTQGAGQGLGGLAGSLLSGFGGAGGSAAANSPLPGAQGPSLPVGGILSSLASMLTFADGGIMTSHGKVPLNTYSKGGVADAPQLALFGEGRGPEAFVPLPDGKRIPVAMQGQGQSSGGGPVNISNSPTYNVTPAAGVTPEQLAVVMERNNRDFARSLPGLLKDANRRRA